MIKKRDIMLIVIVLLLAGAMALVMRVWNRMPAEAVRVMVDGNEYGSYALTENQTVEINNEFGYNRIVIENGRVSVEEADCPDQYCVEHAAIGKTKEVIVCLPHKLVVEIMAPTQDSDIDGISQ